MCRLFGKVLSWIILEVVPPDLGQLVSSAALGHSNPSMG